MLKAVNIKKNFPVYSGGLFRKKTGVVRAIDGLSLHIQKGESFGLVGESGCGKSTTARVLARLEKQTSGRVFFKGQDISQVGRQAIHRLRRKIQIVFQDPCGSLNPRMPAGDIIGEPLLIHGLTSGRGEYRERVDDLMEIVGLDPKTKGRYSHEFSGGQRQRIGIARALSVMPQFLVCDEPVSALDVSIQAQIITLLQDLQEKYNLTYLFIAHDLAVVRHVSNRVAVMYLGNIVELGDREVLYHRPHHPYTRALLSSVPVPDPIVEAKRQRQRISIERDLPSVFKPFRGCKFHSRCVYAMNLCREAVPPLRPLNENNHQVACHLVV